jgi:hypothetical protein
MTGTLIIEFLISGIFVEGETTDTSEAVLDITGILEMELLDS